MNKKDEVQKTEIVPFRLVGAELVELFAIPSELKVKPRSSDRKAVVQAKKHFYYFPEKAVNRFIKNHKTEIFATEQKTELRAATRNMLLALFDLGQAEILCRNPINLDDRHSLKTCRPKKLILSFTDDFAVPASDVFSSVVLPEDKQGHYIPLGYRRAIKLPLTNNRPADLEDTAREIRRLYRENGCKLADAVDWIGHILWKEAQTQSLHLPSFEVLDESLHDSGFTVADLRNPNRVAVQMREVVTGKRDRKRPKRSMRSSHSRAVHGVFFG